jgi:hypothetical protein
MVIDKDVLASSILPAWDAGAEAERAAVVAWLRDKAHDNDARAGVQTGWSMAYREAADAIEARTHLENSRD